MLARILVFACGRFDMPCLHSHRSRYATTTSVPKSASDLRPPASDVDWTVYHAIRRRVLFELRGNGAAYDANHPDERAANHHPLLFWTAHGPVAVIRVDVHGPVAIFRRVAVREDVQRRGYGRRLLEAAERFAQAQGCTRAESHVDASAVGFYERCGFVRVEAAAASGSVLMGKQLVSEGQ